MDTYRVTAGYVTVQTTVNDAGGRAHVDISRGEILPADVPAAEVQALLRRGVIELVDEHDEADDLVDGGEARVRLDKTGDTDPVPQGAIAVVMDWVGDDPDRAQRALEAEEAGERPRSTLVDQLKQLLSAGE